MTRIKISIEEGVLEGLICENKGCDAVYYSFQGIPYAKPPIGPLRFKAPQPVEPWQGVKDATRDGNKCYARDMVFKTEKEGSEDCLYLNVYTPKLLDKKNQTGAPKSVMVFIHGGGFTQGSNIKDIYGPDYLVREDVVLVTINYRLGMLGFLSLEDPDLGIPGNAGIKDAIMALKWVQRNIGYFGGDPNNVTVFGESAGSVITHYLVLSPLAKGLFHKAIMQSGCALNEWGRVDKRSLDLAKSLGKSITDEREMLDLLRNVPVEVLHDAEEKLPDVWDISIKRPIGPVIEHYSSKDPKAVPDDPVDIIKSGEYNHVPIMCGYNDREGMLLVASKTHLPEILIEDFEKCIPCSMRIEKGSELSKKIAEQIRRFYFGSKRPTPEVIDEYYKLNGDTFFFNDIYRMARLHVQTSTKPLYFYRMSIETNLNLYKRVAGIKEPGACHADDLGYLFCNIINDNIEPNSLEDLSVRRFCKLWTNFAKFGDPTPNLDDKVITVKWKPVSTNNFQYLEINKELYMDRDPDNDRIEFWKDIYTLANSKCKF